MSEDVSLIPKGPQDSVLPAEPAEALAALEAGGDDIAKISQTLESWPAFLPGWAKLGEVQENQGDKIAAYSAYRVGYHRGLDKLRGSGWRGTGYVRWEHKENLGFLRSLAGLQRIAELIGETEESVRCQHFLQQLDPDWQAGK